MKLICRQPNKSNHYLKIQTSYVRPTWLCSSTKYQLCQMIDLHWQILHKEWHFFPDKSKSLNVIIIMAWIPIPLSCHLSLSAILINCWDNIQLMNVSFCSSGHTWINFMNFLDLPIHKGKENLMFLCFIQFVSVLFLHIKINIG